VNVRDLGKRDGAFHRRLSRSTDARALGRQIGRQGSVAAQRTRPELGTASARPRVSWKGDRRLSRRVSGQNAGDCPRTALRGHHSRSRRELPSSSASRPTRVHDTNRDRARNGTRTADTDGHRGADSGGRGSEAGPHKRPGKRTGPRAMLRGGNAHANDNGRGQRARKAGTRGRN
jgi:hypothetical protein